MQQASFQHYILVPELSQASYIVVCHFLVAAERTYLELSGVFVFHVLPMGYCACAHACVLSLFSRVWDMLWLAPIILVNLLIASMMTLVKCGVL